MIVKGNSGGAFDTCPEFTGQGVCVDVTPLKKTQTAYGEKDTFKLVFEVGATRKDGTNYCVWSFPFTPGLGAKSNLRKFLKTWLGRDLTENELEQGIDMEQFVGRAAFLVIGNEKKEGETYANIVACTPDKTATPMKPSGKFVRAKDREAKAGAGASYSRAEQSGEAAAETDWRKQKVHVGKHAGVDLGDLDLEAVKKLISNWLPEAKKVEKPKADDKRLIAALEKVEQELKATEDVPY